MSLSSFTSSTSERSYRAAGVLFIDPTRPSSSSQILLAIQPRKQHKGSQYLHVLGGRRDNEDRNSVDTCCRELYEESGYILPTTFFEEFLNIYNKGNMKTLYFKTGCYSLYLVDITYFSESHQEVLRSLPDKFNELFPNASHGEITSLLWVNLQDFLASMRDFTLKLAKFVHSNGDEFEVSYFATSIFRRGVVNNFLSTFR
ncbi:hypothetical protein RCL1_000245 [Eukaryota sp. TZLM3-RCL]